MKKGLILTVAALLCIMMLAGCTKKDNAAKQSSSPSPTATVETEPTATVMPELVPGESTKPEEGTTSPTPSASPSTGTGAGATSGAR